MKKTKILLNEQEQQELMNKEFKNKKVLNACAQKWFGPEITPDELKKVNGYLNLFYIVKQRFSSLAIPELITFFNRYPNFEPNNIPNATKYTLEQMLFILNEYYDLDVEVKNENILPEIFIGRNLPATPERQEASKEMLWYNTNLPNLIINENGFRVYQINTQAESKAFGYFLYSVINDPNVLRLSKRTHINQWCITAFDGGNMYSHYRSGRYNRSYYFAIDETKSPDVTNDPEKFKYFLSVIQYTPIEETNFVQTSMFNDGDMIVDKNQLLKIYPKLNEKFDLFKYFEYNEEKELGSNLDIVDRITEDETNPYAFFKVNRTYKERYIRRNKIISKKQSWISMSDDLKKLYINSTTLQNYNIRYQTGELIDAIKENNNIYKTFKKRLKDIGVNMGHIMTPIYSKEYFFDEKVSILNRDISLFKHRKNSLYGIFNKEHGDWHMMNGIIYDSDYKKSKVTPHIDSDKNKYITEHFQKTSNAEDPTNFYIVIPMSGNRLSGYFMSRNSFEELTKTDEAGGTITGFVPDEKSDLKEIRGGV